MEIPPVFALIMSQSGTSLREMFQVFNMGHRMEIYLPEEYAGILIEIANRFGIQARVIGNCIQNKGKKLTIRYGNDSYEY
jgi:phosphoribosylformylglycinamidine cyclo-ligase